MKKSILKTVLVATLVAIMALSSLLVACDNSTAGAIVIIPSKTTAEKGDTVKLTIATNPKGEYEITSNHPDLVVIEGDTVKFVGDITEDVVVTITVTMKSNSSVKESVDITFKAPYIPIQQKKVTVVADKDVASKGETVNITVTTDPVEEYTLFVDPADLAVLNGNVLTMIGDVTVDKYVTVKAVLNSDANVFGACKIRLKAPVTEGVVKGENGDLTSDLIAKIGSDKLTVIGKLGDYYTDFKNTMNSTVNEYDFKVILDVDKWYGEWNHVSTPDVKDVKVYEKSDKIVTDANNIDGNALMQVFVNKDNQVERKLVKNYVSYPSVWQTQHLWNHLGNLDVNTFEYDPDTTYFLHTIDVNNEDDLYLMTYLSYSLTPMLEDTLYQIGFKVEGDKIIGMVGQTETLYYGDDTNEDPEAMSYSAFDVTFSELGSSVVPEPAVYEAPEHADLLTAGLNQLRNATSYTFQATDVTTRAPSLDDSDYSTDSVGSDYRLQKTSAGNYSSSKGTVGVFGQVTQDAVLLASTSKYEYTLDGENAYVTKYTGYKQVDENYYDYFEFNYDAQALKGKYKEAGSISDILPKFDFSSSIFSFEGASSKGGVSYYTFALRDSAVNRDIALQVSMHSNAKNCTTALDRKITIIVDDSGNLVSVEYPYNFGEYYGYIKTTYSKVNETVLADDVFDGYVQRVWSEGWDGYICKYFNADPENTPNNYDENAEIAFKAVLGDRTAPSPLAFMEAFGDHWHGPFFDYTKIDVDADGHNVYKYEISINAEWTDGLDENTQIIDFDAAINRIINAFGREGFKKDSANSTALTGRGIQYLTLINEETDVQLVIQNIGSHYFYISIYVLGGWTLNS